MLYVFATVGGELGPAASISLVRGLYVLALAPPLSAFLFVATSANSVNAWLGGMRLSRQIAALEALGISRTRYLWAPSWLALCVASLVVAWAFAAGLFVGGLVLCKVEHVEGAYSLLISDLIDPVPDRAPYRWRALFLTFFYAAGTASNTIARADEPKDQSDDVTRAMTTTVVSTTLWVVLLELASLLLVRAMRGEL